MQKVSGAAAFLAKRVAVTGVFRNPGNPGGNFVYQRLRDRGYGVFAVNPNAEQVEGDPCYYDLASIPGGVGAVVVGTRPEIDEVALQRPAPGTHLSDRVPAGVSGAADGLMRLSGRALRGRGVNPSIILSPGTRNPPEGHR